MGKRFEVEMGATAAGQMGFDVSTQTTYNQKDNTFHFVVRPTIRVIRGKPGASTTELQKVAISRRLAGTEQQLVKHKTFITSFPNNYKAQITLINNLQASLAAAIRACNIPLAQQIQIQVGRAQAQLKKLQNNLTSAKASIPRNESEVAYLQELLVQLGDVQHILVKFEIYNDSGGKQVMISGQGLPARKASN